MSYTLSFDASLKMTNSNNFGDYFNHFARELNETEINHSNQDINKTKTNQNVTMIFDREKNEFVTATSHDDIENAILTRLSDVIDLENQTYKKTWKKVRKDAVLSVGMILQLDPQYFKDLKTKGKNETEIEKEIQKSTKIMLKMAQKRFGKQNIVAYSLHLDETNPHLHLIFVPVTKDCRLSQKDFIDKPKLLQIHKEFRTEMRTKGYDIDMNRKTVANAKRLSEEDYKTFKDAENVLKQIEAEREALEQQKREFEQNTALQKQLLVEKEAELREKEKQIQNSDSAKLQRAYAYTRNFTQKQKDGSTKTLEQMIKDNEALYQKNMRDIEALPDVFTQQQTKQRYLS